MQSTFSKLLVEPDIVEGAGAEEKNGAIPMLSNGKVTTLFDKLLVVLETVDLLERRALTYLLFSSLQALKSVVAS